MTNREEPWSLGEVITPHSSPQQIFDIDSLGLPIDLYPEESEGISQDDKKGFDDNIQVRDDLQDDPIARMGLYRHVHDSPIPEFPHRLQSEESRPNALQIGMPTSLLSTMREAEPGALIENGLQLSNSSHPSSSISLYTVGERIETHPSEVATGYGGRRLTTLDSVSPLGSRGQASTNSVPIGNSSPFQGHYDAQNDGQRPLEGSWMGEHYRRFTRSQGPGGCHHFDMVTNVGATIFPCTGMPWGTGTLCLPGHQVSTVGNCGSYSSTFVNNVALPSLSLFHPLPQGLGVDAMVHHPEVGTGFPILHGNHDQFLPPDSAVNNLTFCHPPAGSGMGMGYGNWNGYLAHRQTHESGIGSMSALFYCGTDRGGNFGVNVNRTVIPYIHPPANVLLRNNTEENPGFVRLGTRVPPNTGGNIAPDLTESGSQRIRRAMANRRRQEEAAAAAEKHREESHQ